MTDLATAEEAATTTEAAETATSATTEATTTETTAAETAGTTSEATTTEAAEETAADDWRARMAGDDDKLLGFLGRYQSEKAFVEAAKKDRETARSKLGGKLPENPTDEDLAEYRKQNDIPDDPKGYLDKLSDGLVIGDDDKPALEKVLAKAHAAHASPAVANAFIEGYYELLDEQAATQSEAVAANKRENDDALREEWGPDYRRNVNATDAYLATLPAEVSGAIVGGTDDKGMPLGANADFIKWLTGMALEANPLGTVVPGAGANQASAIADEMKAIEDFMRTNRSAYNKDEAKQARYRELIEAKLKLDKKG
jgi:hypothetical protein